MIKVEIPQTESKCDFSFFYDIPKEGGVYVFYFEDQPVYVGKAEQLQNRICSHITGKSNTSKIHTSFQTVEYFLEDCPVKRDMYETYLINELQPEFNYHKCFLFKPKYVKFPSVYVTNDEGMIEGNCMHIKDDGKQCKMRQGDFGYCHKHSEFYERMISMYLWMNGVASS